MKAKLEKGQRVLLLTSYCEGTERVDCSDEFPCDECLRMDNVVVLKTNAIIEILGGLEFLKENKND